MVHHDISRARRWIRALLRVLPFETRRRYGHEMEQVFLAQHEEARTPRWRWRLWLTTATGVLRLAPREQWETTRADLRSAVRVWRATPLLAATLLVTTAGAIAAVTAAFSLVDGVLLQPLPVADPASLYRIRESHDRSPSLSNVTYATFLDLEAGSQRGVRFAAARPWFYNLMDGGTPERVAGAGVSGGFFGVLGLRAQAGRLIGGGDDKPGHDRVVVLGDSLWRRRFGADPAVIGRLIRLDGAPHEVVGVLPAGAEYPLGAEIWKPLVAGSTALMHNRRSHLLQVIGRVPAGAGRHSLQAALDVRAAAIERAEPASDPGMSLHPVPVLDPIVAPVRLPLLAALFGAGLLLVVLCGNVAHVLLARAADREREFAVRAALGASRGQLARLLLTEGMALAAAAGLLGTFVAWALIGALPSLLPATLPRVENLALDLRGLAVAWLAALLAGAAIGVAPAFRASGFARSDAWRTRGPARVRWLGMPPGSLLGAGQLVLAFVLLTGALLLVRSASAVLRLPLGFDAGHLLRVDLSLAASRLSGATNGDDYVAFVDPLLRRLEKLPGVEKVGLMNGAPLAPGAATTFAIVGRPAPPGGEPLADIRIVDAGLIPALGVPLRAGRLITPRDSAHTRPVVLVSETLARDYFPGENAVGRSITMKDWGPPLTGEIVGVVGDVAGNQLEAGVRPTIYWPYPQFPQLFSVTLFLRTHGDPAGIAGAAKAAIWSLEPQQPVARAEPMSVAVSQARALRLTLTGVLTVFASLAVLFALLGVYAILAHRTARQMPALGIRAALGAGPTQMAGLVVRDALRLGLAGMALGLLVTASATRAIEGLLFGVRAGDPLAFAGAAAAVGAAVLLAALLPALRVASIDPITALRSE